VVDGTFAPSTDGGNGPNPGAATGNMFTGNTWSGNVVNAADFSGWNGPNPPGPATPMANTWGSPSTDSCDPTAGGSAAVNAVEGGPYVYAC
jgi:hypothetical protein